MCFEKPVPDISDHILQMAEDEGRNFARKLKAKLYTSPEQFYDNYWGKHRMLAL
jgi:hypothetical protein